MLETMRLLFAEEGRVTLQYTMTQVERFQHTWCYQLSCVDASVVCGDFPQAAGIFQSATETDAECQETKSKIHQKSIPSRKLTWNLKITCLKRKIIFQTSIFGFHVSFQGVHMSMPLNGEHYWPKMSTERCCSFCSQHLQPRCRIAFALEVKEKKSKIHQYWII